MNNICNKVQPAVITPTLAAGSVSSPYFWEVNISQRLCFPTCVENAPVFSPQFSLVSVVPVGTDQYMATITVQGTIPCFTCNGGCCCTKQQPLSQVFTIPIYATGTPTVTISAGASVNSISASGRQSGSRSCVSETPLTVTVTTAAA